MHGACQESSGSPRAPANPISPETQHKLGSAMLAGELGHVVVRWPDWPVLSQLASQALPPWQLTVVQAGGGPLWNAWPQATAFVVRSFSDGSHQNMVFSARSQEELERLLASLICPASERVLADFVPHLEAEMAHVGDDKAIDPTSRIEHVREALTRSVGQVAMHCRDRKLVRNHFQLEGPKGLTLPEGLATW